MFGLFQTTPSYAGDGQPTGSGGGGAIGWLTGIFAFPGTPGYLPAAPKPTTPAPSPTEPTPTDGDGSCTGIPAGALPMAIVIQRSE